MKIVGQLKNRKESGRNEKGKIIKNSFFLFALALFFFPLIGFGKQNFVSKRIDGFQPSSDNSAVKKYLSKEQKTSSNILDISFYRPTYVLPFYYTFSPYQSIYNGNTPDNQKVKKLEFKAQLSLLLQVWKNVLGNQRVNLNFAYTQLSFWQFYASSQYFRETDYEPEIFFSYKFKRNRLLNIGVTHQSNGRGGSFERSWNRAYVNMMFSGEHWMFSVKPWVLIFKNESSNLHNPNITHYLGNGRLLFAYKIGRFETSLKSQNNLQTLFHRGSEEITFSFYMGNHFYLYLQGFDGYGQSLIEYDHRTRAVGLGIAINDWI